MQMQHFKIAGTAAAVMVALLVSVAVIDRPAAPEPLPPQHRDFETRWREDVGAIMLVEAHIRQTMRMQAQQQQSKTELNPLLTLPATLPEPEPEPEPRPEAAAPVVQGAQKSVDICARHGLRKVYRGRSWRCRAT